MGRSNGQHLQFDGIDQIVAINQQGTCLVNLRTEIEQRVSEENGKQTIRMIPIKRTWEGRDILAGKVLWSKEFLVPEGEYGYEPPVAEGARQLSLMRGASSNILASDGRSFFHLSTSSPNQFPDGIGKLIIERIECPSGKVLQTAVLTSRQTREAAMRSGERAFRGLSQSGQVSQKFTASADGNWLAALDAGEIHVLSATDLSRIATHPVQFSVPDISRDFATSERDGSTSIFFNATGNSIAVQNLSFSAAIAGQCQIETFTIPRSHLSLSPAIAATSVQRTFLPPHDEDLFLLSGQATNLQRVSNIGMTRWELSGDGLPPGFDPSGRVFLATLRSKLAAWDMATAQKRWSFEELSNRALAAARQLSPSLREQPEPHSSFSTGIQSHLWHSHGWPGAGPVSPLCRYVVVKGSLDAKPYFSVFDAAEGTLLLTRSGEYPVFSPDDEVVAFSSALPTAKVGELRAQITILRLPSAEIVRQLEFVGVPELVFHDTQPQLLIYSRNDFLGKSKQRAALLEYRSGKVLGETEGFQSAVAKVASGFPDGKITTLDLRQFSSGKGLIQFLGQGAGMGRRRGVHVFLWNVARNEVACLPTPWEEVFGEPTAAFAAGDTRLLLLGRVDVGSGIGTSRAEFVNLDSMEILPPSQFNLKLPDYLQPSAYIFHQGGTALFVEQPTSSTPKSRRVLWDLKEHRQVAELPEDQERQPPTLTPDGRWLITSACVFDMLNGQSRPLSKALPLFTATFVTPVSPGYSLRAPRDSLLVLRSNSPPQAFLVDGKTGNVSTMDVPKDTRLLLSPDGQKIVAVIPRPAPTVVIWDAANGKPLREVPLMRESHGEKARSGPFEGLRFSQDGSNMALVVSGQVWIVNLENGRVLAELPRSHHVGKVNDLDLSPDGKILATCGEDEIVGFWHSTDGGFAGQIDGFGGNVRQVVFAGRRDRIVTLVEKDVTLWKLTCEEQGGKPTEQIQPTRRLLGAHEGRCSHCRAELGCRIRGGGP